MKAVNRINVLGIAGSLRSGSYNRKALQLAKRFAEEFGVNVQELDLKELNLPMYDEDMQSVSTLESVQRLKSIIEAADVILIASPEYNYSIPGGLKNALDWASRGKNSLDDKVAAIFGVSGGPFGTIRMQPHLRQILTALNIYVVPQPQVFIRFAHEAFNSDGTLVDPKLQEQLKTLVYKSLMLAKALKTQLD